MSMDVFNRHEIKYMLSDDICRRIIRLLGNDMVIDEHNNNGSFYHICNIYYDTPQHDIIRKSIDKPVYKEKLRLRSYGMADPEDKVYLEMKKKFNGLVNKRRTGIRLEDAYRYITDKEKPALKSYMNLQVLGEIDYFVRRYQLCPMVFLSYDRYAFYGKEDNSFRVTIDTNIRSRRSDVRLDSKEYGELLLPPGMWIMEAKAETAVPLWFARLLSEECLYPTSFSKYGTEYKKNILGIELHKNESILKLA